MVVRASLAKLEISEVPTTLSPDGRSRAPHLRTWHDGWRHLRFLLLFSPRWLFLIPGLVLTAIGLLLTLVLSIGGELTIGSVTFQVNTLVYSSTLTLVGVQAASFAVFTRIYAVAKGFLPRNDTLDRFGGRFRLERGIWVGVFVFLAGLVGTIWSVVLWQQEDFGGLDTESQLRVVVPSTLGLVLGVGSCCRVSSCRFWDWTRRSGSSAPTPPPTTCNKSVRRNRPEGEGEGVPNTNRLFNRSWKRLRATNPKPALPKIEPVCSGS